MKTISDIYHTLHDDDLFLLFKEGDKSAFSIIFDRYHSLLYNYSYKKLGNKHEAQDIVQNVMINIWEKRKTLPEAVNLSSYLFTSVRNRSFDLFARKKVQEKYLISLDLPSYVCKETDFLLRENEIKSLIEKEISALPIKMQEIFRLSRLQHLSHKEIAELLNLSPHTIDTQIKRALKVLKNKLGPLYVFVAVFY